MASPTGIHLEQVHKALSEVQQFLCPYLPLANAHASNFLTENYWEALLPAPIRDELMSFSDNELKLLPYSTSCSAFSEHGESKSGKEVNVDRGKHFVSVANTNLNKAIDTDYAVGNVSIETTEENKPTDKKEQLKLKMVWHHASIQDFTEKASQCSLEKCDFLMSVDDLTAKLTKSNTMGKENEVFIGMFMNEKKCHEVKVMSNVCATLSNVTECQLVVDFGSGKGYLGNHLCLQYQLPVLGIDAMSTNTTAAERRKTILDKQWDGLKRNANYMKLNRKLTKKEKTALKELQKQKTQNIDAEVSNFVHTSLLNGLNLNNDLSDPEINKDTLKESKTEDKVKTTSEDIEVREKKLSRYIPVTDFINADTDFMELAKSSFPELFETVIKSTVRETRCNEDESTLDSDIEKNTEKSSKINKPVINQTLQETGTFPSNSRTKINLLLTGLHTCGNLASSSLELFVHSPDLTTMCSVGCCYHLLEEEFLEEGKSHEASAGCTKTKYGFPMSQFLKGGNFSLGNSARNLASQSVHRVSTQRKLQGCRFYPRALLELIVAEVCKGENVTWTGLRKLEQKCQSTHEYIRRACDKLDITNKVSDDIIQSYIERYSDCQRRLAAFFQLRTVLAPCIESLIILDRLCFLLEQDNVRDVYLVKMFDPVISPRCYGIVATKV